MSHALLYMSPALCPFTSLLHANPSVPAPPPPPAQVMETTRNVVTKDSALLHDVGMSFYSSLLHGRLHFFHFETRNMVNAIDALAGNSDIAHNIRTIGCTGGGAHKFAKVVDDSLDIQFEQMDELGCLIRGMHFALTNVENECYTYRNAFLDAVPETPSPSPAARAGVGGGDASAPAAAPPVPPSIPELKGSGKARSQSLGGGVSEAEELPPEPPAAPKSKLWQKDVKEYTQRVEIPKGTVNSKVNQFPYLVVNIGSGVSILKINGPGQHERVSGSSVGGGTYWGLCRLLMSGVTSYEEVLDKAETGDASEIDMLVRDIYGGGYDNISLSGSMVASSFGKLTMRDTPREGIREEDLAIALLMMITNNIGQVSYLNAKLHSCSKIYFVGSFLRHNQISCRRLAFAIDFWSKGTQEALFLQHEGYFGALGTFLQSAFGEDVDRVLNTFGEHVPDARDLFVKNEKAELFKATRARARSTGMVDIGKHRVQDGNISKLA